MSAVKWVQLTTLACGVMGYAMTEAQPYAKASMVYRVVTLTLLALGIGGFIASAVLR